MSDRAKSHLQLIALGLAIAGAIASVARAYFVTPVEIAHLQRRSEENKAKIDYLLDARARDHALLERIDERTGQTQKDILEIKSRLSRDSSR